MFDTDAATYGLLTRYAKLSTIRNIGGKPVPDSYIDVDESQLDAMGMTELGFIPHRT